MNKITIPTIALIVIASTAYAPTLLADNNQQAQTGDINPLRTIDNYINNRQYQSALHYIQEKNLLHKPIFTRRAIQIVARYYISTQNFRRFTVKNITPEETISSLRQQHITSPKALPALPLNIDSLLYQQLKKHPNSPDIQFAIGDYLSFSSLCRCHISKFFKGKMDADFYTRAYDKGVYDAWSLYRMGMHGIYSRDKNVPTKAISLLKRSLSMGQKTHPDPLQINYLLAAAYFHNRNYKQANFHANNIIGKFDTAKANAEAYTLYGRINSALGYFRVAKNSFRKAMGYMKHHQKLFSEVLLLHIKQGEKDNDPVMAANKYQAEVKKYLSENYAKQELYDNYSMHIDQYGMGQNDLKVLTLLGTLTLSNPQDMGILNYNLGKLYYRYGRRIEAQKYSRKALLAFKTMPNPPQSVIKRINNMLYQLGSR